MMGYRMSDKTILGILNAKSLKPDLTSRQIGEMFDVTGHTVNDVLKAGSLEEYNRFKKERNERTVKSKSNAHGKRAPCTKDEFETAKLLRAKGLTTPTIAHILGRSESAIRRWLKCEDWKTFEHVNAERTRKERERRNNALQNNAAEQLTIESQEEQKTEEQTDSEPVNAEEKNEQPEKQKRLITIMMRDGSAFEECIDDVTFKEKESCFTLDGSAYENLSYGELLNQTPILINWDHVALVRLI